MEICASLPPAPCQGLVQPLSRKSTLGFQRRNSEGGSRVGINESESFERFICDFLRYEKEGALFFCYFSKEGIESSKAVPRLGVSLDFQHESLNGDLRYESVTPPSCFSRSRVEISVRVSVVQCMNL